MITQPPAFLITQNDAATPGVKYLVYTRKPAYVAIIHELEEGEAELAVKHLPNSFRVGKSTVLQVVHQFDELSPDEMKRLARRAENWLKHSRGEAS